MSDTRTQYWATHYALQHQLVTSDVPKSMDYSNDRVRVQTYAFLLDAAAELAEKVVVDVGCGWGNLSLAMHGIGARVIGFDLVPATIQTLISKYPFIDWRLLDMADPQAINTIPEADCIVACESLHFVNFQATVSALWARLRSGGRLVASVPNAECPIVKRVVQREGSYWSPLTSQMILDVGLQLPNLQELLFRGLSFRGDQRYWPYSASEWSHSVVGTPNRIVFVMIKQSDSSTY